MIRFTVFVALFCQSLLAFGLVAPSQLARETVAMEPCHSEIQYDQVDQQNVQGCAEAQCNFDLCGNVSCCSVWTPLLKAPDMTVQLPRSNIKLPYFVAYPAEGNMHPPERPPKS